MQQVVLVDSMDNEIGVMEKMEAHRKGLLHRAFSILIYNSRNEMLLQKRAHTKYHSANLWSNACCSHPQPKESILTAAHRRLLEELGIETPLTYSHKFIYQAALENELVEHECDHVFSGTFDGTPEINQTEVAECKFMTIPDLLRNVKQHPEQYTTWFKILVHQEEFTSTLAHAKSRVG
jgi:isopentenyl-diphosphate Delta-isomerase